jgi:diguanylate cyclase (GGDEF)-like protein
LVVIRLDVTELVQKSKELERVNEKLARLSTTDGLTGIANRRMFDQTLLKESQRSGRNQQPLGLLLVDIDYFKRYNDRYGHLQGDECLRQVASILESCVKRSGELVARYGGEEFALLLPNTSLEEACIAAQRCADEIAKAKIMHADSPVSPWLTLSIGVVSIVAAQDKPPESLVRKADLALYSAKASGRARYEVADLEISTQLGELATH